MQLLCLGDSITDCGHLLEAPPLGNGYVQLLQNILTEKHSPLKVSNGGIDGMTAAHLLQGIQQGTIPSKADLITLLVGINDLSIICGTRRIFCQQQTMMNNFFENYRKLVDILNATQIFLLEPFLFTRPAEFLNWFPFLQIMADGISAIAKEKSLTWIPLQKTLLQQAEKMGTSYLSMDGIHLTSYGHQILAEHLIPFFHI